MKNCYTFLRIFFIFLASVFFISISRSQTSIPAGNVNGTWTLANSPYNINGDITISNGNTLNIQPGVTVIFQGHYKINIQGRLLAIGTATNMIMFKAANTRTGWKGLRFVNTLATNDSSKIVYCSITAGNATTGTAEDRMGGAIFSKGFSKILISNNIITNNVASFYGGGICCGYSANPLIINNVINNNTAQSGGGGIYCYSSANPKIINNTIANNSSSFYGGIYANGTDPVIKNCIIWGNSPGSDQIYPSYLINVSYSDVQGSYTGTSNINSNPGFNSPSSGAGYTFNGLSANWSLQSGSPCINAGISSISGITLPEYDLAGNLRIDYDTIDLGAYEYLLSIYACGSVTSNTTWSGFVKLNCDVTVNNGVTLTIQPGTHIECLGHYKLNIKGRLLAEGTESSFITFTSRNSTQGWGGIRFDSTANTNDTSKFEYCIIKNGKANSGGSDNYGGGVFINHFSKLRIRNCIISNNYASMYGGGIYCNNGSPKIISNVIVNNTANSSYGGGIYISDTSSSPKIINNSISNNVATLQGGGIYSLSDTAIIRNNIIWGNTASVTGIGKQLYPTTLSNVRYCDIEGGVYPGSGNISSNPSYKNASSGVGISYNGLSAKWALQAGSPCINAGGSSVAGLDLPALDLRGRTRVFGSVDIGAYEDISVMNACGTISGNTTWNADTVVVTCNVIVNNGAKLTIAPGTKVIFNGHYKLQVSGSLWAIGTPTDSIIFTASNTTTGWQGIRIYQPNTANDSTKIMYCRIEYGKPTGPLYESSGGAIYVYDFDKVVIAHCNLSNNVTPMTLHGNGGAIYVEEADIVIRNNIIKNNISKNGSGIYFWKSDGVIGNNIISNNSANNHGGGLYIYSSDAKVYNNYISNNSATNNGGGIFVYTYNIAEFVNNNIVNNDAAYGGGINCSYDCPPIFVNNTIAYNKADSFGGGFFMSNNSDPIIKNCIFYGNTAKGSSNQLYLSDIGSDPKIYYSDIQGGKAAFGGIGAGLNYTGVFQANINRDPIFRSPTAGAGNGYNGLAADWYIKVGSYCINSGTPSTSGLNLPARDLSGNKRLHNGRIDMGAYENQEDITVCSFITENTTWDADTIKVTCDVIVNDSITLTITEGTYVQFQGHYKLEVKGRILAIGAAKRMITFSINDTTYFSNVDSTRGGWDGIKFLSTTSTNDTSKFVFCRFHYGKKPAIGSAAGQVGGALFIYNTNKILISNSLFTNNRAGYKGGAIYIESSHPVLHNNTISNNTAYGYCPVVCFSYGGGIYIDDGDPSLVNNTITNNMAHQGGGVFCWSSSPVIRNSILWGNVAAFYGASNPNGLHQMQLIQGSAPKIYNCDIQGGRSKIANNNLINTYIGNIDLLPEFNSPSTGAGAEYEGKFADWSTQPTSPCVNAGIKTIPGLYHMDLAGNQRIVGDTLDIGAFETQISRRFITSHPTNQSACIGTNAIFSVSTSLQANFQWQKDGLNIPGAKNSSYIIPNVSLTDSGDYACVISNIYGSIHSDTVSLLVKTPPLIVSPPTPVSSCLNEGASFIVSVNGTEPIFYQWYNTNGILTGATNDTFTIYAVRVNDASNYYCITSNSCGLASSSGASLTIKNPPIISSIPVSTTMCESNSLTFTTSASGTSPISFQWYFNGNTLVGDTTGTLNIPTATDSNTGYYYCKATNMCGSDSTNTATVTVNVAPSITSQTSNTTICEGQSMTFSITAGGTTPITYQWYYNSSSITGATNNTYTINSISASDAGSYYCIATNSCGTAQSNGITLTVNQPPAISTQTQNSSRCVGQGMTFSITATGTAITYQWYNKNGAISGATNNTYTINAVDTSMTGNFYCVVSNTCGSLQSSIILLTVDEAPNVLSQSPNSTICEGQSITLSVTAGGTSPITYQWYFNNSSISGATNNTYSINSTGTSNAGTYYCIVSNTCGSVQSNDITLTVKQSPNITAQSSSVNICVGQSTTFSITAQGTAPIFYQWYYDTTTLASATNNTYAISSVTSNDAGNYYCIATNSCGIAQSSSKTLTVNTSPSFSSQTPNTTICLGQSMTFTVSTTGTTPITYQWYDDNGSISGATNNTYTINSVDTSSNGSYYCIATNTCSNVQSNNINLYVNEPPTLISQSSNATQCVGQGMTFSVTAAGTTPISYQWYYDTISITSATNNIYTINAVSTNDAGNYYCIATNSCGNAQSTTKTLTVNTSPVITSQTSNSTRCVGQNMTFTVTVTGTTPMSYQWYYSNVAITGAMNNIYMLNSISSTDAGDYYCIATNACGSDQSNNISLTVNIPPSISSQTSNGSRCIGQGMTFDITVAGTSPIIYQWYGDTGAISNATNNIYSINYVDTMDEGNYYCMVSNSCGSLQSSYIFLSINKPPSVITHSDSSTLCSGVNTVLNVSSTGTPQINYQWYYKNVPIPGALNNFYIINSLQPTDAGNYHCIATNDCGSDISDNINLIINDPISINSESGDSSKCVDKSMLFEVTVGGTLPFTYQWFIDTNSITNETNNAYFIDSTSITDAGLYHCKITNYCGTISSSVKKLTVNPLPNINIGTDSTFCKGGTVTLSPGSGYFCEWNNGSINPQLVVDETGNYSVQVTDIYGCQAHSDTVNITVIQPYPFEEICVVTIDPRTGKNLIAWERTKNQMIIGYNIYKESHIGGVYQLIETQPFDSLSEYTDITSNPRNRSDRYRITAIDTCGNESAPSIVHRTIHLTANKGTSGENNLNWNHYEGFAFGQYYIYRGNTASTMSLYDSIKSTANSISDTNPPPGLVYYQVSAVKLDTCDPTTLRGITSGGPYTQSLSNLKDYSNSPGNYLATDPLSITLDSNAGSVDTVNVFTNAQYWSASTYDEWIGLLPNVTDANLTITALTENTGSEAREGFVTISADGVADQIIIVNQLGKWGSVGISKKDNQGQLKIYPNPFIQSTHIILPQNETHIRKLEVFDISGKLARSVENINGNRYELFKKDLAEGLYFIRVIADRIYFEKVVVE